MSQSFPTSGDSTLQQPASRRVRVDGKFFRLGPNKFFLKGLTYGPFRPNAAGEFFPELSRARADFELILSFGANVLRVYYVPPPWLLDLGETMGIKFLVDVPWNKHICFLDSEKTRQEARAQVLASAQACARHPATFGLSVVNEIPPDIVRWGGADKTAAFIEELVEIVKSVDATCLCTFGNFPPTEYLRPGNIDFFCFNVYLHHQKPFDNYLARLQMIADVKPLILGEFGVDSIREGEQAKSEILAWQIETAFRAGLAGAMVYSFSDDWFKEGGQVTDWAFGVTDMERQPKASAEVVKKLFTTAPYFPLAKYPMVSVVVASYNGERTLRTCLESLQGLNYPAYEVILVDDGSDDGTALVASDFKTVRYIQHGQNKGLSVARNTGISAARGEIVAFTDSDCRADEDWLYYLVADLLNSDFAGIGGHNLLPPEDSWVAACVMVSPGGLAHVMLTDRLAEHIPGCNMAFYKWALDEIEGFDPVFRKAGDDVDVCWRLQQAGLKLGFSPAGFVWHYRRSTVRAYLKQQEGYGEAEALLVHRHPEYFNWMGGSQWQGRIYSPAKFSAVFQPPRIYHGWFGSGFFQTLYTAPPSITAMLLTSFEYHVLVNAPLVVLAVVFRSLIPLAVATMLVPVIVCGIAAMQADLPGQGRQFKQRLLIALLFFLQPIVRGWARYGGSLGVPRSTLSGFENLESLSREKRVQPTSDLQYWNEQGLERTEFINFLIEGLDKRGWQNKMASSWNNYDLEIYGSSWNHLQLTTVAEVLGHGKQLIRCRLRPKWTMFAKVSFSVVLALELLLIGLVGQYLWWSPLLLLSLPAVVWILAREQRDMQRLIGVFLDEVAGELRLKKIETTRPSGQT